MSATKRRAGAAASPEMSTPDPVKRRKRNDDTHFPDHETAETTTEIGMKLMRLLKKSQDKNGRNVAGHFLDLPGKDEYPEYYQAIKMPLSLNMIEVGLEDGEYENMEKLEADLKRLVQNAKDFNATRSEVYEDAERIRKALSNFMPKHNPAYLDSNYRAYAAPIPRELLDQDVTMQDATPEPSVKSAGKIIFKMGGIERPKGQAVSTEPDGEVGDEDMSTAQLELLDELGTLPDSENFYEKPSKKIPGYYAVIKQPTSIADVKRMIEKGKIKDWNTYAAEVRLIWDNCKTFNEEGSDIYAIAEGLEAWFEDKVQALGASPRANIKIKFGQPAKNRKLKLSFSTGPSTPGPSGAVVDNESLRRQKEETAQALSRANRAGSRHGTVNGSTSGPTSIARGGSVTSSSDRPKSAAMTEDTRPTSNQSVPDFARSQATVPAHISKSLPTPAMDGQPPPAFAATMTNGGVHHDISYAQPSNRNIFAESDNPIDRKYRDSGKGLEDAILGSVTFQTHPKLPNDPKWKLNRHASATKTQTSGYIYLPSDHYYLRVTPNLTVECRSRKRHKVCVTRNWEQIYPSTDTPGSYDFRIHPGENIIAVDVIADLPEGETKSYAPAQLQIDFERITFVIMLREITPA